MTTDHSRGRTAQDWVSHGKDIPGASEAWLAVFGPGVKLRGEASGTFEHSLSNVAATILDIYGLSREKFNPGAAGPILPQN